MGILAAILLLLVTMSAAVFIVAWYVWPEGSDQNGVSGEQSQSAPAGEGIQVGVFLSGFTATGPHRSTRAYGYQTQLRPVKSLRDPSIHLIPVVEPGFTRRPGLLRILSEDFPGETPLDAGNLQDLRKLDVLVATSVANVPNDVIPPIMTRVREGMGLVQRQFGYLTPGYDSQMNDLCGFTDGVFGWNASPVPCEVVGNHPLLGDLAGQIGKTITLVPNGTVGHLKGIPLLRITDMKQIMLVNADRPVGTGEYLYPLYISQWGHGKIVGIGFTQGKDVPPELEAANHGRFYIHCVEWLMGKPLN
jgi:hypothetical protein